MVNVEIIPRWKALIQSNSPYFTQNGDICMDYIIDIEWYRTLAM